MVRVNIVKMPDGTWFKTVSPTGRTVTTGSWIDAYFYKQDEIPDMMKLLAETPGSQSFLVEINEPKPFCRYIHDNKEE